MRFNTDRQHAPRSPSRDRARDLRREENVPERVLWSHLRNRKLDGLKFRRQHPIGPYTADFYCPAARLVVEIDGRSHDRRRKQDDARDRAMAMRGIHVLRFTPRELARNRLGVLNTIAKAALERLEGR